MGVQRRETDPNGGERIADSHKSYRQLTQKILFFANNFCETTLTDAAASAGVAARAAASAAL